MMHGSCRTRNPQCPCMVNQNGQSICKHKYPRRFSDFTTHADDGYPTYGRRNTGKSACVRGLDLDNRRVVPYNIYLLAYF